MILLDDSVDGLGTVFLPVVAGLLLEELTLGGLARLLLAPWWGTGKGRIQKAKHNNLKGVGKCSH
ncbi:MAG TPA: hypothetical protein VMU48_01470 [Terracidiphilus sp.]|nr:hypothetical protein [Terracidiphilus sp.]